MTSAWWYSCRRQKKCHTGGTVNSRKHNNFQNHLVSKITQSLIQKYRSILAPTPRDNHPFLRNMIWYYKIRQYNRGSIYCWSCNNPDTIIPGLRTGQCYYCASLVSVYQDRSKLCTSTWPGWADNCSGWQQINRTTKRWYLKRSLTTTAKQRIWRDNDIGLDCGVIGS